MQTILGATGQIGIELAKALKSDFTDELRLVSRRPEQVSGSDQLMAADLLDAKQTLRAVESSEVVYFTAGLPLDTELWEAQFPLMIKNVIAACATHKAKLVFFDNTYMYPQTSEPQVEGMRFAPNGRKGKVRAQLANMVQEAIDSEKVVGMICRAPEFYGPGKTQSITNVTVFDNLRAKKTAKVFISDTTLRSLTYTPDASRAMALLGNTPDAYGQTWHLPCDDERLTYRQLIGLAEKVLQRKCSYKVLHNWQLKLAGLVNKTIRESWELLPRYKVDNIFVSDKFKQRFPEFKITAFYDGFVACFGKSYAESYQGC
jgi:nucleoside-diphosphate-sugar epimerase